jgi:SAM-dependent methyltransferase
VIHAWLHDLDAAGRLDRSAPVPIIELGCGTGRFTFHLLRALEQLNETLARRSIRWTYIATDISKKRLDFIGKRREFQKYFETKQLRTAFYDALSGRWPSPRLPANPAAVICNYVLDSLPADCFLVRNGKLYETLIRLSGDRGTNHLDELSWRFSHRPAAIPYYGDRVLDLQLEDCVRKGAARSLVAPCGALRCLENLQRLVREPLLVLVADKASAVVDGASTGMPHIERHGRHHYSLPVDFDLLAGCVRAEGGRMLVSRFGHEVLCFAVIQMGTGASPLEETLLAFEDRFNRLSPCAALYATARLEEQAAALTIHDHLAYLRIACSDPNNWLSLFPLFRRAAVSAPPELRPELVAALDQLGMSWYPPGGSTDLAFLIGSAFLELGEPAKAQVQFERSIEEYGGKPATLFQLGRAVSLNGNPRKGAAIAMKALRDDPHLAGFLQRLGLLPELEGAAYAIASQMEWEAELGSLDGA